LGEKSPPLLVSKEIVLKRTVKADHCSIWVSMIF